MEDNAKNEQTKKQQTEEQEQTPVDAKIKVFVEQDRLSASMTVSPPENGGKDVTKQMITDALKEAKIVFGIDEAAIDEIVEKKHYLEPIKIAEGTPPVHGIDGDIEEKFARERELKFLTKEDGTIDFKTQNIVNNVKEKTVICEITKPIPPVDGQDVYGNPVKGRFGREPIIPAGENTELIEDGTLLVAKCEGNLVYKRRKFNVEKVFQVKGDMDNSIGNIDFCGDVIIRGDVCEGYVLKAKGDVTVKGMVEGASIYAGGSITLMSGINGMGKGILESKEGISSKYIENCTIKTKGTIQVESIINSTVFCDDKIVVTGRRGAVIGGVCTAFKSVEAKVIGTHANTPTTIILGATPDVLAERKKLYAEIEELKKEITQSEQNVVYLEKLSKFRPLNEERKKLLLTLKRQKPINLMKQSRYTKRLKEINEQINDVGSCRLTCSTIYPPTRITIGNESITVKEVSHKCSFYYADGEIKIGYE